MGHRHYPRSKLEPVMAKLPKGLTELHIRKAVDYVERETAELVDLYFEQANVFSAIVVLSCIA